MTDEIEWAKFKVKFVTDFMHECKICGEIFFKKDDGIKHVLKEHDAMRKGK